MDTRNYALVTGGYWAFTLTDGALRMLVLLHFNDLGYSPVSIAFLFVLYEAMGVITNLIGGWVGARAGLTMTLRLGLALQICALIGLSLLDTSWAEWVIVVFAMGLQAVSGIAKDLTKMSSKSAVKFVAGADDGSLFRLVALLTGSKNALKGVGFFLGAMLLSFAGYQVALWMLAAIVAVALAAMLGMLRVDFGKSSRKPPLRSILSKSTAINRLAAARLFLFASRDIWFVVALPVFLNDKLGWPYSGTGGFLAAWVIGYGAIQAAAPKLLRRGRTTGNVDEVATARSLSLALAAVTAAIAALVAADVGRTLVVVGGLIVFGVVFALNSSLHSFLILAYTDDDDVSLDVGFYYSANAVGRLLGTLLSGVLYLWGELPLALFGATISLLITWTLTMRLPTIAAAVVSRGPNDGGTGAAPARTR